MNGLDRITRDHIITAIEWFEDNNIPYNDWSAFDFEYNNKIYPPKPIICKAISYVYKNVTHIYDIEDVLNLLIKHKFITARKNNVWKLGCNWGSKAPSFYEVLKEQKIVIGTRRKGTYQKNDLVLLTEGFTVKAIVKIISDNAKPIPLNLVEVLAKYELYVSENITYYDVEFYELSPSLIFLYELQQGLIRVRSKSILIKTDNLWNDRTSEIKSIEFRNYPREEKITYAWKFPLIALQKSSWDDYGYRTLYNGYLVKSPSKMVDIGELRIASSDNNATELPKAFKKLLSTNYFSLGLTPSYYEKLVELFPNHFEQILNNLNDVAKNKNKRDRFIDLEVFKVSFLRGSEGEYILNNYTEIIQSKTKEWNYEFSFRYRIENADKDHKVHFSFGRFTKNNYRFYCIVGKNATGKTKYLSQLTNKLTNISEVGEFAPARPYFTKVIATSFSFFDKFKFPKKQDTNYEFIGIKNTSGIINEKQYSSIIWRSYKNIVKDKSKNTLWANSIETSLETEYLNFDVKELKNISNRDDFIKKTENIFSSGQNIIFQFITRFIETIEQNSILIFDEPETHLHPNIAGRLLRTIHNILIQFNSFCILATHSPVIVQEIPSKFIRIFDRQGNTPLIYAPVIECFGENLSEISNTIFKVDEEKELYKIQLDELINQGKSFEQINDLFEHGLSLNARIYLLNKINKKL